MIVSLDNLLDGPNLMVDQPRTGIGSRGSHVLVWHPELHDEMRAEWFGPPRYRPRVSYILTPPCGDGLAFSHHSEWPIKFHGVVLLVTAMQKCMVGTKAEALFGMGSYGMGWDPFPPTVCFL